MPVPACALAISERYGQMRNTIEGKPPRLLQVGEFLRETLGTAAEAAPDPQDFLKTLPPGNVSALANLFHDAVRAGQTTAKEVCIHVVRDVEARLAARYMTPERAEPYHALIEAMRADPAAALAYAAWVIAWRALPQDERNRLKAERGAVHQAGVMAGKPATEKQIRYLSVLGYTGPPPENSADASRLIDELKNGGTTR